MTEKDVYKKVQLLKAGQIVEINNDWFQAVRVDDVDFESCCQQCDLDSICRGDVFPICCEPETAASHRWMPKFAHP